MKLTKKELNIIQECLLNHLRYLSDNAGDIDDYHNDYDFIDKLSDKIQIEIDGE